MRSKVGSYNKSEPVCGVGIGDDTWLGGGEGAFDLVVFRFDSRDCLHVGQITSQFLRLTYTGYLLIDIICHGKSCRNTVVVSKWIQDVEDSNYKIYGCFLSPKVDVSKSTTGELIQLWAVLFHVAVKRAAKTAWILLNALSTTYLQNSTHLKVTFTTHSRVTFTTPRHTTTHLTPMAKTSQNQRT